MERDSCQQLSAVLWSVCWSERRRGRFRCQQGSTSTSNVYNSGVNVLRSRSSTGCVLLPLPSSWWMWWRWVCVDVIRDLMTEQRSSRDQKMQRGRQRSWRLDLKHATSSSSIFQASRSVWSWFEQCCFHPLHCWKLKASQHSRTSECSLLPRLWLELLFWRAVCAASWMQAGPPGPWTPWQQQMLTNKQTPH